MRHLQLTLDTPAENLALDEALLDAAEVCEIAPLDQDVGFDEGVLRLWESPSYCVVLGRSSVAEVEVDVDACRRDGVPVLRRSSGGGTILCGPGCLMYAVVLSFDRHPQLQAIDQTHEFVLEKMSQMLSTDGARVLPAGTSDLSVAATGAKEQKKFSGNAMRMKRRHVLYHGTLLYDFDLAKIPRWLATPTRTPTYRAERQHVEFVTNLQVERLALVNSLLAGWQADNELADWPKQRTANIVNKKYTDDPKWVVHQPSK